MTDGPEWIVLDEAAFRFRLSPDFVVLEDHWIPKVIEVSANGEVNDGADPETYARIEVGESGPRLVELRFISTDPDSQGIRQTDLRDIQVSALTEEFVSYFTFRVDEDEAGAKWVVRPDPGTKGQVDARNFVSRTRGGKTTRDITPQLLERVAKVYRQNIDGYPTKAVQHHFQVSQRMAAEYVSRARKRGLLPPTKKGKKQA